MAKEKKSLGNSLVENGLILAEQLRQAQVEEKRLGKRLRYVLVKMGFIDEEDLVAFISKELALPRIELANYLIDPKIIELVPENLARKHEVIPVLKIGNRLTCAMVDPWNIFAMDEIRIRTNLTIEPAVSTEQEINAAIDQYYGTQGALEDLIKAIDDRQDYRTPGNEDDLKKLKEIGEEPIVIKLVNLTIMQAIRERASDIHIEPEEERLKTRFRVDGILREVPSPPKYLHSAIISRIKILANLNIAERRKPQDGRFGIQMEGRTVDVRVACMPTMHGENIVLRLLDTATALAGLELLGFSAQVSEKYQRLIARPYGIILITGPTGSGKTTTLYSSLNKINSVAKHIITIEEPIEYALKGIRQIQVNPIVDLTFANGLRSILRQDPDIIMVGEIRDHETAEIAIQAALTGHLVFSTLHTNDAPGAITRLIDMGIAPFLVASALIGVLAQRLARVICRDCKVQYIPTKAVLKDLGLDGNAPPYFYRGQGCAKCGHSGYKGRIGIMELMLMDDAIRNLTTARASLEELRKRAVSSGMIPLQADGIKKIVEGLTTVEEIMRITLAE